MKKRYLSVKEGVRLTQFYHDKMQRWQDSKGKKFEAKKTIDTPTGRRSITERFRTMPEVNAWLQSTVEVRPLSRGMGFEDLVAHWKESAAPHIFISTRTKIFSRLKFSEEFFRGWEVRKIDRNAIDRLLAHGKSEEVLSRQKSTRLSYKEELEALRKVLGYYGTRVDPEYRMPFLPEHRTMMKVRERKVEVRKDLSLEQRAGFLKALRDDVEGTEFEGIYFFAELQYSEAARAQEIAALEVADIDFASGSVRRDKRTIWARTKGAQTFVAPGLKNRDSMVGFSRHSLALIKEWMLRSGVREGLLFPYKGKPFTYRTLQYRYDKALKAAGIPFTGTHILRHACACEHYETGKDLQATKEKLGHKDMRSTQRYAKSRAGERDKIQALMDEKLGTIGLTTKVGTGGNSVDFQERALANSLK